MAKNLKLNIKNLQLAGALKPKTPETKESEDEQTKAQAEAPSKARTSRLKDDASVQSALKQADKTLANRDKEKVQQAAIDQAPKKRKSRLIQEPGDSKADNAEIETKEEEPAAKVLEETPPQPVKEQKTEISTPAEIVEEEKPKKPAIEESPKPAAPIQPIQRQAPMHPPRAQSTPSYAPRYPQGSAPRAPIHGQAPAAPAPVPAFDEAAKQAADLKKAKDLKTVKKKDEIKFDSRDRQGLRDAENEAWRKRRAFKPKRYVQEEVIRPKNLSIRLPITIKDLAQEMKLKASQLIAKLFMQGMVLTLNDYLDDETVVQLLGHEFGCDIKINTTEQDRINITDKTIRQEIGESDSEQIVIRPPVVTFMGHVDHGKTSLIDAIRKSNRVAGEAGAITQHIGAFKVSTAAGDVTILDTPGHEAFTEMRERGANVTDIVILVIAGDEGMRAQTDEAIRQAREAKVPILVAMNKCDKENFDVERVYRELADRELLPEAWGGTIITVECSAVTGKGIQELLEMIALQAEILELRANPNTRARGTILESEMHKGLGAVATVLVQNGTLRKNDAIVFGHFSGRIKTMHDDHGKSVEVATPSTPVKITGLSELALAGSEFIVVKNEKEARELAAARAEGIKRSNLASVKLGSMEKMLAKKEHGEKKILPVILRADVQGSLEALKTSLSKIKSEKVRLEIVNDGVGEISESDIELAAASKATIVGFHTRIESHAESLIKQKNVALFTQDVIYHLVDDVKGKMRSLLDKIAEEKDTGSALVKAVFKSSQTGNIAGCQVSDGTIKRNNLVRQLRGNKVIWKGKFASLKRVKEDVKEVQKGFECGIVLEGQSDVREGDIFQAYEITYLEQDL